jgi:O-antigen/teichoic acid export membrane protein
VSAAAGCLGLMLNLSRSDRLLAASRPLARARELFVEFNRFPKYSALEALTNSAAIQVPVIAIASLASGHEAGFVFLAMYTLQAPMSLVGAAIGQVYLSEAPDHHRKASLAAFTVRVFGGLVKVGAGPLLFAALVAPGLFPIVFGSEWGRAGVLVVWMVPWFLMQLLSSPLSMALHVTNQQRAALVLQVSGLVLRLGAVFLASVINVHWISEAYAVSGFVFYLLYLLVVFSAVGACSRDVASQLRNGLPLLGTWLVAGLIFAAVAWFYANA